MSVRGQRPLMLIVQAALLAFGAATLVATTQTIGPNDNWGLDRIDQRNLPLDQAFHYTETGAGVNIYIVDSGVLTSLSEFSGRINYVGDFYLSTDFLAPNTSFRPGEDCAPGNGHGTHNASIAAGSTYGVAKQATIWVLRAANCSTGNGDTAALDRAIQWLNANAISRSVVNVSYRPTVTCDPTSPTLPVNGHIVQSISNKQLVYTLSAAGCPFKSWSDDVYSQGLVAAATTSTDAAYQPGNPAPTIYAPGALITASASQSPYYWTDSGDSYAAPHVAGVAAQYLQRYPAATPATVRAAMLSRATDVGLPQRLLYSDPCGPNSGHSDFNHDCLSDLLWQQRATTGQLVSWSMNGLTRIGAVLFSPSGVADLNWKVAGVGDFNNDGKPDVLWQHQVTGQLIVWLMDGTTMTSAVFPNPDHSDVLSWKVVAVEDFDRDGNPDLLWQKDDDKSLLVWFMTGTTRVRASFITPTTPDDMTWRVVATGDFNGDGHPDLLWQRDVTAQLVVWYMDGTTRTGVALPTQTSDAAWKVVGAGDLNGDGQTDLVWQNQNDEKVVVWLMSGTTFASGGYTNPPGATESGWKVVAVH
jgi:Subtilase family/FG-GAP-like repeat/FG-GAP repeat